MNWTHAIIIAVSYILLTSCGSNQTEKTNSEAINMNQEINKLEADNEVQTLKSLLDEKKNLAAKKFPDDKKKIYADGILAVERSGILDKALKINDRAADFSLKNALGDSVSLYEELKTGPVILTWYRGGWCPYCNINLHYLQEKLPEFQSKGAKLIALTPELPDKSLTTTEKNKLTFNVLSDIENRVGKQYGVVFKLTPEVAEIYNKAFNMNAYNGDTSNELPLAATYLIDTNGVIRYAFLDADYRNRAEPDNIIKALDKLNSNR